MKKHDILQQGDHYITKFFGMHPEGPVSRTTITNTKGTSASILTYGAVLQSLQVASTTGKMIDVVLGFDSIEAYMASYDLPAPPYIGSTVGRHAGRINNAKFQIGDKTYQLEPNNNSHSLHGGKLGLSRKLWSVTSVTGTPHPSVTLTCESPDMEDGFPGNMSATVTYTLTENDELLVEMSATADKDTIANFTHHSYFNMDGHTADIASQQLLINASKITETTDQLIPTGNFIPLDGHEFDYRNPKPAPRLIDTTFALDKTSKPAAWLQSDATGLRLSVYTDQPALHIYVGGDLFGRLKGKDDAEYHPISGICFETQHFSDAPNNPGFPSTILRKGETYTHRTIYQLENMIR